jgi:hemoglobin
MKNRFLAMVVLCVLLMVAGLAAFAGDHPQSSEHPKKEAAPSVEEQMAGLQSMCEETSTARAERQAAEPLYDRLGGYDKIHECMEKIIELHLENDEIKHTMEGVDYEQLADHLTDFVSAGTGGTAEYTGRDIKSAHEHLKLTDADFLSAGGDIVKAMKSMEYGENEINEIICILVSMKDQVVLK